MVLAAAEVPFRGAILSVHPFAEDMNKSRRAVTVATRRLADGGRSVLQTDLEGCGGSSDDLADACWCEWQEDAAVAAGHRVTARMIAGASFRQTVELKHCPARLKATIEALDAAPVCHGTRINHCEEPIRFGSDGHTLVGLLSLPASAVPIAARSTSTVPGVVALNPWVNSETTSDQTLVTHCRAQRNASREFWIKLLTGQLGAIPAPGAFSCRAVSALAGGFRRPKSYPGSMRASASFQDRRLE